MLNVVLNIFSSRQIPMHSLAELLYEKHPFPTQYFDFSSTPQLFKDFIASVAGQEYLLWSSDPDALHLFESLNLKPYELHLIIFNGLNDLILSLNLFEKLIIASRTRLIIYTFDKVPLVIRTTYANYKFMTISYPFINFNTRIFTCHKPVISFAAEFNNSFSSSIQTIFSRFRKIYPDSSMLSMYLHNQRHASTHYLQTRDYFYQHFSPSDLSSVVPTEQLLSTMLSDLYRLKLAFNLNNTLSEDSVRFQGNHFLDIGFKAVPTSRFDTSIISGTYSLDPGSHTLSNHSYYRPCDLIQKGSVPVPIGYSYSHIKFRPHLPALQDSSPSSIMAFLDKVSASHPQYYDVTVLGSFPL